MPETPDFDRQHCWHLNSAAAVLDVEPPIIGYQCCHCGKRTGMNDEARAAKEPNANPHGPHRPSPP